MTTQQRNVLKGDSSPEGFIEANRGVFYVNLKSLSTFVKMIGDETTNKGWRILNSKGFYSGEGNPEGVVSAPKYAVYLDTKYNNLYIQTVSANPVVSTGWVCVNDGNFMDHDGDPNVQKVAGVKGDLYIDTEAVDIYVYTGEYWEKILLMTTDSVEVLLKLSELLTNSTGIVNQYFNMFFNPNPMDIELAQYDTDGTLRVYKIPNRAKDKNTLIGEVEPENNVYASKGRFYLDINTGTPYVKTTGANLATGWRALTGPAFVKPLKLDEDTYEVSVLFDEFPMEKSNNLLTSGVICEELNRIRNGSSAELFSAAEPIEQENVTTKNYVDSLVNGMFGYDSETKTLQINTLLNENVTEEAEILGHAGQFFTPMFGTPFSTEFTFTSPLLETVNTYGTIKSDIPCEIIVTAEPFTNEAGELVSDYEYLVDITDRNKSARCFTDEMSNGIRKIKVISTSHYEYPNATVVKSIYKQFTFVEVDKY